MGKLICPLSSKINANIYIYIYRLIASVEYRAAQYLISQERQALTQLMELPEGENLLIDPIELQVLVSSYVGIVE
jgi:hypothetical protein